MWKHSLRIAFALFATFLAVEGAAQNCAWSHVDNKVGYRDSGMWNPNVYRDIMGALTIAQLGGAIWEGSQSRFGKTMWQGVDSEAISAVTAEAGKYTFTRVRPSSEDNPCLWFKGGNNHSFPSGEAATAAGLVTPYILEYGKEYPATYALMLLPLYVGAGRVKNQAHWQTDVIAGWAIGGLSGWYAHSRDIPIFIEILPHEVEVGLKARF